MKSKTFIVLLAVCCVLGGAVYLIMNSEDSANKQGMMGGKLLPDLSLEDISGITIKDHENSVVLRKGEKVWSVENRFSYPADFSKISEIVKKLRDAKIGRTFKAEDKILSRLTLHGPGKQEKPEDQRGAEIILEDKEKKVLADIIIGKAREASAGAGGQYVMLAGNADVCLTDKNFRFLDKEPAQWLDKELMNVKPDDIEKVVCIDPETKEAIYSLRRPEKGKSPEFSDLPEGKKIKKSKVDDVFRMLSSFQIENVADPAKKAEETGLDKALCFEYHLFDGTVYKAYPGNALADDNDKFYFKVDVSYAAPEIKEEIKPEAEGDKEKEADDGAKAKKAEEEKAKQAELLVESKKLNEKISPWTYVISKWKRDNFIADTKKLLEEKEAEAQKPEAAPTLKTEETPKPEAETPATETPAVEAETPKPEAESREAKPVPETEEAETETQEE